MGVERGTAKADYQLEATGLNISVVEGLARFEEIEIPCGVSCV